MDRLTHLNGNGDIYFLVNGVRVRIDKIEELRVAEKLKYYEDLEEQCRLIILPTKEEMNNSRCCKTCYADDMGWDEIDCPCWNCKGDHSEWKPKNI